MSVVRVVQVTIDQIVDVVAVRNSFVAAVWTMLVVGCVACTLVTASASSGVGIRDRKLVFFDRSSGGWMVQMTIVQEIDVVAMLDGGVATACAVLVIVVFVGMHLITLF